MIKVEGEVNLGYDHDAL